MEKVRRKNSRHYIDNMSIKNSFVFYIERVTLPFYKPSQDTTSEHLGLGLNICKILCERHGGTIKISNNHKGGACVTACIKIAYVDEK